MKIAYNIVLILLTHLLLAGCAVEPTKDANDAWIGVKSSYHSFDQYDFEVGHLSCKVVVPDEIAKGRPWVWRARFFGSVPQVDIALLEKGLHIAYVDVAGLYGSPKAVARWDAFYDYLTTRHGFAKKPALVGVSRGGLIVYNWASANPDKVSCIYADAPVCDFKSWPLRHSSNKNWLECLEAYELTEEQALQWQGNPIDNLKPLADAGVPLLHVVGASDKGVPVVENTAIVETRYREMGGMIEVISKPGIGHHPHGLADPTPIVEFILKHTQRRD